MINIHNIFKCVLLLFVAGLLVAPVVAVDYNFTQTINYTACDQPTYQQDIEIHRSVGNNYEEDLGALNIWHIYVGDSCQNDYDDLRFDDGANQELAYYLWPDYDNNSAKFNVNLTDADNIGAVTIKYGNNTVSTTSDGEATFPFFDQFEGIALNTTKWITAPGATVSVSGETYMFEGVLGRPTIYTAFVATWYTIHLNIWCSGITSHTPVRNTLIGGGAIMPLQHPAKIRCHFV